MLRRCLLGLASPFSCLLAVSYSYTKSQVKGDTVSFAFVARLA